MLLGRSAAPLRLAQRAAGDNVRGTIRVEESMRVLNSALLHPVAQPRICQLVQSDRRQEEPGEEHRDDDRRHLRDVLRNRALRGGGRHVDCLPGSPDK
jgi:hypothetical protein